MDNNKIFPATGKDRKGNPYIIFDSECEVVIRVNFEENCSALSMKLIEGAAIELRKNLKTLEKNNKSKLALTEIEDLRVFFHSKFFTHISRGNLDGKYIFDRIAQEVDCDVLKLLDNFREETNKESATKVFEENLKSEIKLKREIKEDIKRQKYFKNNVNVEKTVKDKNLVAETIKDTVEKVSEKIAPYLKTEKTGQLAFKF